MRLTTKLLVASLFVVPLLGQAQVRPTAEPKSVLVTGASTGIGRKITERLAGDGYFVYAGAQVNAIPILRWCE